MLWLNVSLGRFSFAYCVICCTSRLSVMLISSTLMGVEGFFSFLLATSFSSDLGTAVQPCSWVVFDILMVDSDG